MAKQNEEPVLNLLLIDDDEVIHKSLGNVLSKMGHRVLNAFNAEEGLALFRAEPVDIVISDIKMPGMDGLALLSALMGESSQTDVILMTGHGDMDMAVDALRKGAFDFFRKPVALEDLIGCLQRTRRYRALRQEKDRIQKRLNALLRSDGGVANRFDMLGESIAAQNVLALIDKVAKTDRTTVLIQGESGTGKELVARAIHDQSERRDGPFVAVNCTAIPETLLESELFGHEKGAFTDARDSRPGVFELSDGGTLFLDEIGDMHASAQAKILRVLEDRRIRRVGGVREIAVDVRLISATNRELKTMPGFRQDLYFRLNVFSIHLPPLRERGEDVLLLAHYFLKQFASELRKDVAGISPDAMRRLQTYSFPGNVRELRNLIERAVILCEGDVLEKADFPDLHVLDDVPAHAEDMPLNLEDLERLAIERALEQTGHNQTEASKLLGIGHDALHYRIKKYGLNK